MKKKTLLVLTAFTKTATQQESRTAPPVESKGAAGLRHLPYDTVQPSACPDEWWDRISPPNHIPPQHPVLIERHPHPEQQVDEGSQSG